MSATIGERSRKRSGAAVRRPDWAADATLAEIIRRILAAGEPQKIVLFGSRARGDARADSDYDLLLVEPSELPRHILNGNQLSAVIPKRGSANPPAPIRS